MGIKFQLGGRPPRPARILLSFIGAVLASRPLPRSFPWSLAPSLFLLGFVFMSCDFNRPRWRFFNVASNPQLVVWFGSKVLTAWWVSGVLPVVAGARVMARALSSLSRQLPVSPCGNLCSWLIVLYLKDIPSLWPSSRAVLGNAQLPAPWQLFPVRASLSAPPAAPGPSSAMDVSCLDIFASHLACTSV